MAANWLRLLNISFTHAWKACGGTSLPLHPAPLLSGGEMEGPGGGWAPPPGPESGPGLPLLKRWAHERAQEEGGP